MTFYNLDSVSKEFARKKTKFCLVIYDIEGYGTRVQRSCFEVDIEKLNFELLIKDIRDFYQADEGDNIIVYVGHKEETVVFNPYTGAELLEEILFF